MMLSSHCLPSSSSSSSSSSVRLVSTTTVHLSERRERSKWELTAWDVAMLSANYIQKGLLFPMPPEPLDVVVQRLQTSLSGCLLHFYPLSGRLATDPETTTFVDCNDAGAEFVVAEARWLQISDLLSDGDVPDIVTSFFRMDANINYDGYRLPLLAVQVTELADGLFIGCSLNHAVADGESFWNFYNSWSELAAGKETISRSPLLMRPNLHKELGPLRFIVSEDDMERGRPPLLRERIFHFTAKAVAPTKAKANHYYQRSKLEDTKEQVIISSLQALCALMWRCITRARKLPKEETTVCQLAADNRKRLDPPVVRAYFGNCVAAIRTEAKVGELLGHDLGWAARALHRTVVGFTSQAARGTLEKLVQRPVVYRLSMFEPGTVHVGSSPRLEMYGSDFGSGKGLAVRSGSSNKFDGKISAFPACDEEGGIDLEVTMQPLFMNALESDQELLEVLDTL